MLLWVVFPLILFSGYFPVLFILEIDFYVEDLEIVYWSGIEKDKKTFLLVWDYRVECTPSHIHFSFLLSTFLCYLPFIPVDCFILISFGVCFKNFHYFEWNFLFLLYFCTLACLPVEIWKLSHAGLGFFYSVSNGWLLSIIYNIWYFRWKFGRIFQVILFFVFIFFIFSCAIVMTIGTRKKIIDRRRCIQNIQDSSIFCRINGSVIEESIIDSRKAVVAIYIYLKS